MDVPVTATGSSPATTTKFLIKRVVDPQYEGSVPADPLNAVYDRYEWVSSLTGLNYPYLPLARLAQPASTSTITNAMITDLRKLTKPRNHRELRSWQPADGNLTTFEPAFQVWPPNIPTFDIPEWATHVTAMARVHGAALANGTSFGALKLEFGTSGSTLMTSSLVGYDFNDPGYWYNGIRVPTISVTLSTAVPAAMRGAAWAMRIMGNKANIPAEVGYLVSGGWMQVEFDLFFEERVL